MKGLSIILLSQLCSAFVPRFLELRNSWASTPSASSIFILRSSPVTRDPTNNDDKDSDILHFHPNETTWHEMFPANIQPTMRNIPDAATLKPNDPFFLDVPWPTELGPDATAYAKHFVWKRGLSNGERLRWQKWAIYERLMKKNMFQYRVEDYVFQNMLKELQSKSLEALEGDQKIEASLWQAAYLALKQQEEQEVRGTVLAFYSAFKRKNFDEMNALWLPDDDVELVLPGFEKVRGYQNVDKLFRRLPKETKPMGSIEAKIESISIFGYVAIVKSVEIVVPGNALKPAKSKGKSPMGLLGGLSGMGMFTGRRSSKGQSDQKAKPPPPRRVLATTVLRKFNQQWRVMLHHAGRFSTSAYTGDEVSLAGVLASRTRRAQQAEIKKAISNNDELRKATESQILGDVPLTEKLRNMFERNDGKLSSVSRRKNSDGSWENVISVNEQFEAFKKGTTGSGGIIDSTASKVKGTGLEFLNAGIISAEGIKKAFLPVLDSLSITAEDMQSIRRAKDGTLYISRQETGGDSSASSSEAFVAQGSESLSKKTVRALRALFKANRLSATDKASLMHDVVANAAADGISVVESAFSLLVMKPYKMANAKRVANGIMTEEEARQALMYWAPQHDDDGMENFLEQCRLLLSEARATQKAAAAAASKPSVESSQSKARRKADNTKAANEAQVVVAEQSNLSDTMSRRRTASKSKQIESQTESPKESRSESQSLLEPTKKTVSSKTSRATKATNADSAVDGEDVTAGKGKGSTSRKSTKRKVEDEVDDDVLKLDDIAVTAVGMKGKESDGGRRSGGTRYRRAVRIFVRRQDVDDDDEDDVPVPQTIVIDMAPSATVGDIKRKIEKDYGIDVAMQKLSFAGDRHEVGRSWPDHSTNQSKKFLTLEDNSSLSDYNVEDGSIFHLDLD